MVNIPQRVSNRIMKEIPVYRKILVNAKDRDINESDTVTIVTDILSRIFGYDKFTEITSEKAIRGTYCDLAVKLDGKIKYLIEVKAIGLNLKENHLRQAVDYGIHDNIPWVILTNGINWEIHRIKFDRPVDQELVCMFDLTALNPRKPEDQEKIYLLCKEGIAKAAIEEFHDHVQMVNRFMIGAICLNKPVVDVIRRELKRLSPSLKVENEEIENLLVTEVLKRDVQEGDSFESAKKKLKRSARKTCSKPIVSTTKQETVSQVSSNVPDTL